MLSLVFPWRLRRLLLNLLCGYAIHRDARIGWSIVGCPFLVMGPAARIGHFNVVKGASVVLGECASIGDFNWISGLPPQSGRHFSDETTRQPRLTLDRHGAITSRHLIDCSNQVHIGEFSIVAGARSQILTHAIDFERNRQVSAPVSVGRFCFVGAACVLLKGSRLPDHSVLAAHSSLTRAFDAGFKLYSGSPAVPVKDMNPDAAYFHRHRGFVD